MKGVLQLNRSVSPWIVGRMLFLAPVFRLRRAVAPPWLSLKTHSDSALSTATWKPSPPLRLVAFHGPTGPLVVYLHLCNLIQIANIFSNNL